MRSRTVYGLALLLGAVEAAAQELEPRSYSASPIGTTFVLAGFGKSEGGILFDPSLAIENVRADLWVATTGYGRTFSLAGRHARLLVVVPMAWGNISGEVGQQPARQDVSGLVDPRIKLSVGLVGAPALGLSDFARAPRRTVLGASVTVIPPLGQYNKAQLINLGYNRWALKPEIGISHPSGRWTMDAYAGAWLFTTNRRYYPGNLGKEQDPVVGLQGHVGYTFPSRTWAALDATWFSGGQTRVEGTDNPDRQDNTRLGGTVSIPVARMQSVKLTYSTGVFTRRGQDFDTFNATWQLVMF
jgi:hypothetical protein